MTQINRSHYEQAYKPLGRITAYWRKRLSFDQQYKRSVNWNLLQTWLRERDGVKQVNEIVPDPKHLRSNKEETLYQKVSQAGFRILEEVTTDRWAAFFERWREKRGDGLALKMVRAGCALLPYSLSEQTGAIRLRPLPFRQLVVLATPQ